MKAIFSLMIGTSLLASGLQSWSVARPEEKPAKKVQAAKVAKADRHR